MLRAVFNLFKLWQVNDGQAKILLGEPSSSTFYRWKRGEIGAIPRDTVRRLGDLMGIHKALRYMFVEPERSYAWISKPNVAFGGRSASAEAKTNPRVRDQVGDLSLVPVERRLVGPTASLAMSAFTHPSRDQSGFSDGSYGVWYCGDRFERFIAVPVGRVA